MFWDFPPNKLVGFSFSLEGQNMLFIAQIHLGLLKIEALEFTLY